MINLVNTEVLADYIYAYNGVGFGMGVDTFLGNWEKAKEERLFKLMGGKLILEKEIKIEKNAEALEREMRELSREFTDRVYSFIHNKYKWGTDDLNNARRIHMNIFGTNCLSTNRIDFQAKLKIESKTLSFNTGQKTMKSIENLLKAIGYNDMEDFEQFRLEHSRILNDKMLKGTMCLSIHPMDYITVSDNAAGWESCLSWMNDGCYRAGTLELVNCTRTVVAYLKSSKDMMISGSDNTWNSKRWRQLIIADEKAIISNKAYPYASDAMTKIALDWVKELAEKNCEEKYFDEVLEYDELTELCVNTKKVYNDLDGNGANGKVYLGYNATVYNPDKQYTWRYSDEIEMGGEALCLDCGCGFDNENSLHCPDCSGEKWCDYCGEYHYGEEIIDHNGDRLCEYCYDNHFFTCEECNEVHHYDNRYEDDETYDSLCQACYNDREQERADREDAKEGLLAIQPVE